MATSTAQKVLPSTFKCDNTLALWQNGLSVLAGISKTAHDKTFNFTKNETTIIILLTHSSQIAGSFKYPYQHLRQTVGSMQNFF